MKQFDFRSAPILLLGREPDMLALLREVLLDTGFFVVARLSDGFLISLEDSQDRPSLIIYDEAQPEIDSERVFYLLQDNPKWAGIPFMILSDLGEGARVARCLDRGVTEYVSKPFDVEELAARVRKILRHIIEEEQEHPYFELDGFAGDLSYMNLSDLLINLHQNIRTGDLIVTMDEQDYCFSLHRGRLIDMEGPHGMTGRKALYRAIRRFYGKFVFIPRPEHDLGGVRHEYGEMPNLILQAVQEADEFPLISQKLPDGKTQVSLSKDQDAAALEPDHQRLIRPLLENSSASVNELISYSHKTDLEAAQELLDLIEDGRIKPLN